MNKTSCNSLFFNLPSRVVCILLCIVFIIVFTPMSAFSSSKKQNMNTKTLNKSNEVDKAFKAPKIISLAKDSDFKYFGEETKILVKKGNGSFIDETDDILKNGYVGRAGEDTVIRIQLSGYKYKESDFKYTIKQPGAIKWGVWDLYQDNYYHIGASIPGYALRYYDSNGKKYYCRSCTPAEVSGAVLAREKQKSIYRYQRQLEYYKQPETCLLHNKNPIEETITSNNTKNNTKLTRSYDSTYNTISFLLVNTYGYFCRMAESYESLNNKYRNEVVKDIMKDDNWSSLLSKTKQWDTADKKAYDALADDKYNPGDNEKYTVYQDIDLSKISDPNSAFGKYAISLDNGKVNSKEFSLSLYGVSDSPLTMQQSDKSGSVASDNACLKFCNGSDETIKLSTQEANATLGEKDLTLVDDGYFTPSNVENFGSKKAMSKIEAYIDNKNLKCPQKLPDVSASSVTEIPITIKNANAISQQLNGKINIPTTVNYGSNSKSITISVDINSVVPQITVSVPISIYLYMAKDGSSVCEPDSKYYIANKSSFPLSSKVSATIVKNDTTATDENDVPFFPKIDENSPFKLWIKSQKSEKIQFKSVDSSSNATDYRDFGTIGPRDSKLSFNLFKDGDLPDVANPGTYHYKIYFKFTSSENDYN